MKPYGREQKLKGGKPWKTDCHPREKGMVNWWENMKSFLPRSTMKANWKKEARNDIND